MNYVIAGYSIVLGLLFLYTVNLIWRRRRLNRLVAVADSAIADSAIADSAIADSAIADSAIAGSAVAGSAAAAGAVAGSAAAETDPGPDQRTQPPQRPQDRQ